MYNTVRLVNGSTKFEGRVEVYHDGEWGTVCDNGWDLNDAHVVCRGLFLGQAVLARHNSFYGQGNGQIWLDDLGCTGKEKSIEQCSYHGWGVNNCKHSRVVGVKCSTGMYYVWSYLSQILKVTRFKNGVE